MPMNENYGGPLRKGARDFASGEAGAWSGLSKLDPTGVFFGMPTPEIDYEEQPYQAFNQVKTREALANMRAQGPSPAELKTRAALDAQARALAVRGQTATGPLGAQQALSGGAEAQRAAIMAGSQQRAMEEERQQVAMMNALEGERARQFAASRAENQRRYAQETAQRQLFNRASQTDFDRIGKQMALGAGFAGQAYNKHLDMKALQAQGGTHTNLPGYDSFGNKLPEEERRGRAAPRPGRGLGAYSSGPVEIG